MRTNRTQRSVLVTLLLCAPTSWAATDIYVPDASDAAAAPDLPPNDDGDAGPGPCVSDDDCGTLLSCVEGVCEYTPACNTTADCAEDEACFGDQCHPEGKYCFDDADCGPHAGCVGVNAGGSGVCVVNILGVPEYAGCKDLCQSVAGCYDVGYGSRCELGCNYSAATGGDQAKAEIDAFALCAEGKACQDAWNDCNTDGQEQLVAPIPTVPNIPFPPKVDDGWADAGSSDAGPDAGSNPAGTPAAQPADGCNSGDSGGSSLPLGAVLLMLLLAARVRRKKLAGVVLLTAMLAASGCDDPEELVANADANATAETSADTTTETSADAPTAETGPAQCCPLDSAPSSCMNLGGPAYDGQCVQTCDFWCSTNWRVEEYNGCDRWVYGTRSPEPGETEYCMPER